MKKGERYRIQNMTLGGNPIIEGIATLVKPVDIKNNRWAVRFDGDDERTVNRNVDPADQVE